MADDEKKSMLYALKPITDRLPAVSQPDGHVHFRTKMMWLILILILYFILTNVMIYGLDQENTIDLFASYRVIMAGAQGSLMHLGIGPIVTGSIIMQLFVGAKIIKLDLTNDEDKAVYQGVQKFLVIIMIIVESVPQVYGYLTPSDTFITGLDGVWSGQGNGLAMFIIVLQLCFGSFELGQVGKIANNLIFFSNGQRSNCQYYRYIFSRDIAQIAFCAGVFLCHFFKRTMWPVRCFKEIIVS